MSDFKIEDGTGSGFKARVDDENRLNVHADINTEEHNISHQFGRAYGMHTHSTADTLTLATGNSYNLMYLENGSGEFIVNIFDIRASFDTAGCVLRMHKNMTLGTATNSNVVVPTNMNFLSGNTASGVFHDWNEVGTTGIGGLTGGTKMETFIEGIGSTVHVFDGAIVLGNTNNLVLSVTNGTGGNVECTINCRFFYEEV